MWYKNILETIGNTPLVQLNSIVKGVSATVLAKIETIVHFNVGAPARTDRPVIDRSYSYCLLTTFNDEAGHDFYQVAPEHLEFIKNCAHLWEKVIIYDSETI